ncbi:hypothetical protein EGW08_023314 [Elysia chlorotica]|uniref:Mutator-like transposase domain-containing protein n=1 Tax=Elysia chlorotica TaxID=188477 RepID=A0A3S1AQA0_ELYCH|nr:hypothetical protein EGW08_023314 [Elysia chlorotica]
MARKKKDLFKNKCSKPRGKSGGRRPKSQDHEVDLESSTPRPSSPGLQEDFDGNLQPRASCASPGSQRESGACAPTLCNQPGPSALVLCNQPGPSTAALCNQLPSAPSGPSTAALCSQPGPSTASLDNQPGSSMPALGNQTRLSASALGNLPGPSTLVRNCQSESDVSLSSDESEDSLHLHFSYDDDSDSDMPSVARRKVEIMATEVDRDRQEEGYLLVHFSLLDNLVAALSCPLCSEQGLTMERDYKGGLSHKVKVWCPTCGEYIFSDFSSPGGKRKDITKRVVLAAKESGLGYEGLCNFFSILNVPKPLHHKTFQQISSSVHRSAVAEAERCMKRAAEHVAATSTQENPGQLQVPATTISYDGTWHKRGHSSHFGVGVAIDIESGFVLDTQVLSNYCHGCEVGPKPESPLYIQWRADHHCQKNFDGSSNAMEAEAAVAIFRRSVTNRGLVYSKMLCDGDAKAHQKVNHNIYDFEVLKEDCINHISKRMFNALEAAKNSNKKELNRKLTKPNIEKITNTYATNLKRSAPDVIQMRDDVYGGIFHMMSTDAEPRHHLCPPGIQSWCFFQRALALGDEPRKHRTSIKPDVAQFVLPIVDRLTQPDLLKRCAAMQTQNANECFNSLIWARCPKTEFASRRTVETAVALSVLAFNSGPTGIFSVLQAMEVPVGLHQIQHSDRKLQKKLANSDKRVKRLSKWGRKERKRKRLRLEDQQEVAEGPTYAAGGFNL